MYNLEYSSQFKKDLRLMVRRGLNTEDIRIVLNYLTTDGQVPSKYLPHTLKGRYKGVWECHINPDWLLIYDISNTVQLIRLIRTGTHSDLFK